MFSLNQCANEKSRLVGAATCCQSPPNFPPSPSTRWATASPAAGQAEFEAVQRGACYCNWPKTSLNCASCGYCKSGPRPAGYPFGPNIAPRNGDEALSYTKALELNQLEVSQQRGDCSLYGLGCQIGPGDWLAPTGARSVMIAPGVWNVLPNHVPPAVAINAYNAWRYVDAIYDTRKGKIFRGCNPGRAGQCGGRGCY